MLGWPNTYALNARYLCLLRPGDQRLLRRRNRARECESTLREVAVETARPHHETWLDAWSAERPFDMNDEYTCPSVAVWRALVENDYGLRDVDFTGVYTTDSEKV